MAITSEKIKDWLLICEILGCSDNGSSPGNPLLKVDEGLLWVYDKSRGKWLSSSRFNASAGEKGRVKNKYLRVYDSQIIGLSGWRVPRNGTIVSIIAQTSQVYSWTLRIRKNGGNIASLTLNSQAGKHSIVQNVDITAGDRIQFFAETAYGAIRDPLVWVEIAWRNTQLATP